MPRVPSTITAQPSGPAKITRGRPPAFAREQMSTRAQNAAQENARRAGAQSASSPFADGNLIAGIEFIASTPMVLNHGLARAYRGYLTLRVRNYPGGASNPALLIEVAQDASLNASQITLVPQGTFVADVWVY